MAEEDGLKMTEEMYAKADLVVIAKALSTKDSGEKSLIGDVRVRGVNTEFQAHLILKGDKKVTKFVLHHYRMANPDEPILNRPAFASFRPNQPKPFLLFLMNEADGRYAPVNGQLDPAGISVIKLDSVAE